jgi:VWFA-related protein
MPLRLSSLALLLAFAPLATAQSPAASAAAQPAPPTLKLSTRIVVLDVVVTDKKGNLVDNLTRDDFTILEDKIPQTIRGFDPPSGHVQPPDVIVKDAQDLKEIGDAPVTILVLDELNTRFEDMSYARNATIKYLKAQPAVLKQPTVLLLATNTRFLELHDYTQDRDALIDVINHHMPEYPSKMMAGKSGGVAVERIAQSLASLEQIAQASSGTPGRKNVLWIGNGFPSANIAGLDPATAQTILDAVKQCTDMLLAARITMYTINPTANSTTTIDVSDPDDMGNAQDENGGDPYAGGVQFSTFAPATGGRAFLSRNDIHNEIAEGIAAGANYYTLAYAPTNRTGDTAKYRNIRIVMKDPNLHATTRNGYYPAAASTHIASTEPPKQARAQLQLDISSAVNSAISYNGLDVQARKDGPSYLLTVKSAGLDWNPADAANERAEATIIAAWYDAKGKLLGHSGKELTALRPASSQTDAATFTLPIAPLPPSATRLRLIVRDASNGHMGTTDLKP